MASGCLPISSFGSPWGLSEMHGLRPPGPLSQSLLFSRTQERGVWAQGGKLCSDSAVSPHWLPDSA